jgi:hypothetical protein
MKVASCGVVRPHDQTFKVKRDGGAICIRVYLAAKIVKENMFSSGTFVFFIASILKRSRHKIGIVCKWLWCVYSYFLYIYTHPYARYTKTIRYELFSLKMALWCMLRIFQIALRAFKMSRVAHYLPELDNRQFSLNPIFDSPTVSVLNSDIR